MKSVYEYLTEKNDVESKVIRDYLVNFASIPNDNITIKQSPKKITIEISNIDIDNSMKSVDEALAKIGFEIDTADNSEGGVKYIAVPLGGQE